MSKKLNRIFFFAVLMGIALSGCYYSAKPLYAIDNTEKNRVISEVTQKYSDLSAYGNKRIFFNVRSDKLSVLVAMLNPEARAAMKKPKVRVLWEAGGVKSVVLPGMDNIKDVKVKAGVQQILDLIKNGLNSTLRFYISCSGPSLIGDASGVDKILKNDKEILLIKRPTKGGYVEKLLFSKDLSLNKVEIFKVENGDEKNVLTSYADFVPIRGRYFIKRVRTVAVNDRYKVMAEYEYQDVGKLAFPEKISYSFKNGALDFSEEFHISNVILNYRG